MLRFFARLDTNRPIDMDRTFIISFFLSDDTISVFEPEKRNSGIVHGKFIERSKIKKPSGEYYQAEVRLLLLNIGQSRDFTISFGISKRLEYIEQHSGIGIVHQD